MTKTVLIVSTFVLLGCGIDLGTEQSKEYTTQDIKNQTPKGKHNGQDWSMLKAQVEVDSFDSNRLEIELYNEEIEVCKNKNPQKPFVRFTVTKAEGTYPLGISLSKGTGTSVNFVTPPAKNTILTQGLISIEKLTDTLVTVGLVTEGGEYHLNGRFTVDRCPAKK